MKFHPDAYKHAGGDAKLLIKFLMVIQNSSTVFLMKKY